MEGQILGNRYELIEKIGGGGMAIVYKAKCHLLNRYVAVKILRPEFTNDEEFVKRFRIEAQSAASLSHPNIVSIYDVGNDGNTHYIIMEYVDGITLKDYIKQKEVLQWREAVNISIQICSAIEMAHRNHIVHRDIKPHNILLTKDGIAKVTDFGIARAVSSSTITMVGSTIGSVHYFSPEQARGGYIDEKSDLYSLGIALYEMVTGKLPFDGDTPIAIALKHIQTEAQPPIEINQEIPDGVNSIILKAIKKDQNKRYQSAPELLGNLNRVLKEPYGEFVIENGDDSSPTRRVKAVGNDGFMNKEDYLIKDDKENLKPKKKKNDKLTYVLAGIISLVVIVFIFYAIGKYIATPLEAAENQDFVMQNYMGQDFNEVKNNLIVKERFLENNIQVLEKFDDEIKEGCIISQSIEPGRTLKRGGSAVIVFTVSKGREVVKIPDWRNDDYRTVEDTINSMNLKSTTVDEFNDTVGAGCVIRTDPAADSEVSPNTNITIYISKGPETKLTKVPDLIGKTYKDAEQLILAAHLVVGETNPPDIGNDYVVKIIQQQPVKNTEVNEGTAVDLVFETSAATSRTVEYKFTPSPSDLENYGDQIKVMVEATPSDTGKPELIYNEEKNKGDFPITLRVRVPANGSTKVSIYLDNKFYMDIPL